MSVVVANHKLCITDLDKSSLEGKTALVRVDFNVPIQSGDILDDSRIQESLPTIQYLVEANSKVVLVSHLGRPKGVDDTYRLDPIQARLSELLSIPVTKLDDCIGDSVQASVQSMSNGDLVLLENVRFYSEETLNDHSFSKALASLADFFVLDAFGTAHRAHSSTCGVAEFIPAYSGLLLQKELHVLSEIISSPKRPFLAIVGGSKVSTKLPVLKSLLGKVDTLFIGGGMVYTFLKAQGFETGTSLVEDDQIDEAALFLDAAKTTQTKILFPEDHVVADKFSEDAAISVVASSVIPETMMGLDMGPESIKKISELLPEMGCILWNGPVGVFEMAPFAKGTMAIASVLADCEGMTVVGGGDSVSAIKKAGVASAITHVSTGGGAVLELLEGKVLPGVSILNERASV